MSEYTPELLTKPTTQLISADRQRKGGGITRRFEDVSRWANVAWHSDVSFENVPSDYSMLKVNVLPPSGGDTHWINCYDVGYSLRGSKRMRTLVMAPWSDVLGRGARQNAICPKAGCSQDHRR